MIEKTSIRLKAALLLTVFFLNTLIGFACAIGIDMGFNSKHHHDEEAAEVPIHVHADGAKHHHHKKTVQHTHDGKSDCCNDKVIDFQNIDKNIGHAGNILIASPEITAFLSSFFGIYIPTPLLSAPQKYVVRFFHPPPPDIRVLIRSFQI